MKCAKSAEIAAVRHATGVPRRSWAHIFCNLMRSPPSSFNDNRSVRASVSGLLF